MIDELFQLREFDRCRTLYTKFLEYDPASCAAWIKFADLEKLLGETERCRAIFELGINQPALDKPELLWKAYIGECMILYSLLRRLLISSIDFEIGEEEYEKTRELYLRLLERTEHVKVYISFAQFELSVPYKDGSTEGVDRARKIFEDAYDNMKKKELKEEVKKARSNAFTFCLHESSPL